MEGMLKCRFNQSGIQLLVQDGLKKYVKNYEAYLSRSLAAWDHPEIAPRMVGIVWGVQVSVPIPGVGDKLPQFNIRAHMILVQKY